MVAVLLVAVAFAVPPLTGWEVWSPPRSVVATGPAAARWVGRRLLGPGTPAGGRDRTGGLVVRPRLAERLSWGRLMLVSYVVGLAWLLALALVDGTDGITRALGSHYEYLPSARGT